MEEPGAPCHQIPCARVTRKSQTRMRNPLMYNAHSPLESKFSGQEVTMKKCKKHTLRYAFAAVITLLVSAQLRAQDVSYSTDIKPIIKRSCQGCHLNYAQIHFASVAAFVAGWRSS